MSQHAATTSLDYGLYHESMEVSLDELIPQSDELWPHTKDIVTELGQSKVDVYRTRKNERRVKTDVEASVAVIVPTYNIERFIEPTLESISRQSKVSVQIAIVDDGSDDDTPQTVLTWMRQVSEHVNAVFMRIPHIGNPGVSRNIAIANLLDPSVQYIAFMDGDDLYHGTDALASLMAPMEANANLIACYGDYDWIDEQGKLLANPSGITRSRIGSHWEWKSIKLLNWENLARGNIKVFHLQCLMVRRGHAPNIPYRPIGEDEEYYARLFALSSTLNGGSLSAIAQIPMLVAHYRRVTSSLSARAGQTDYPEPVPAFPRRVDTSGEKVPYFYDAASIPDEYITPENISKWLAIRYMTIGLRRLRRLGLVACVKIGIDACKNPQMRTIDLVFAFFRSLRSSNR